MTALLIFGIVALILISISACAFTVLVSKALSDAFRTLNSMHKRNGEQVDRLLDRLVAIDWEKYASLRSLDEPDVGGFFAPSEEEEEGGLEVPNRFPRLTALRERVRLTPEEEVLLAEDFDEVGTPKRAEE